MQGQRWRGEKIGDYYDLVVVGVPLATRIVVTLSGRACLDGQVEMKTSALPFLADDADLARVQIEYPLGNGKAESHGALAPLARLVSFIEAVKYARQDLLRNAGAGVGDRNADRF